MRKGRVREYGYTEFDPDPDPDPDSDFDKIYPNVSKAEGFRVKASDGEVVVLYFEPSATQNLESSGFPTG